MAVLKKTALTEACQKLPDKAVFFLFHTPTVQVPPGVLPPAPARIFLG